MAWTTVATVAIIALTTAILYALRKSYVREKELQILEAEFGCARAPPWTARFPAGLDLLAQAFWHGRNQTVMEFFLKVSELSGATHEQRLLGARNIGTTAPKNLEAVLNKQSKEFGIGFRIPQFRDLLGSSVLTQEGPDWHRSRDLLRPLFSSNRIFGFDDIQRSVETMLDGIELGRITDLQPLFFQLTLETTLFMMFGDSAHRMIRNADGAPHSSLMDALNDAQEYLAYRTRVGDLYWLIDGPGMRRACKTVHAFVDAAIDEALDFAKERRDEGPTKRRYVLIDALIEQTRDRAVLRDQCTSILIAGRDTTAACLGWTMRALARHQEALVKVREELASIAGVGVDARKPSREDLKHMTFLSMTMKESLRLHPPVPVNQRAATETTTLPEGGGPDGKSPVLVRKGESVGFLIYALHRRKDIYGEDAYEFRPERWQGDALKKVGYAYLPFGAGQRACLGQEFAMLEAKYTIARLIQRFPFISVPEGEECEIGKEKQLLTIALSCAEGCRLRLS